MAVRRATSPEAGRVVAGGGTKAENAARRAVMASVVRSAGGGVEGGRIASLPGEGRGRGGGGDRE